MRLLSLYRGGSFRANTREMTKIFSPRDANNYDVNNRRRTPSFFLKSSSSYLALWVVLALFFCSLFIFSIYFNGVRKTLNGMEIHSSASSSVVAQSSSSNTSNSDIAEGEIYVNTDEYDEELLRMVQERKKKGSKRGKIAWLMSFPNSGTSFTSLLVRLASNTTSGTNYGMETNPGASGMSIPVYEWSEFGPYWIHPPGQPNIRTDTTMSIDSRCRNATICKGKKGGDNARNYDVPPLTASIITKTHCGSRCVFCPPQEYLETDLSFLGSCLSGSRKVPSRIKHGADVDVSAIKAAFMNGTLLSHMSRLPASVIQYKRQHVTYNPAVVEKAIHLVRNPFNNLVSRFHHEQKENPKQGKTRWVDRYSNDVTGFKRWCADEDTISERTSDESLANWTSYGYPEDIAKYFRGIPCHAEFVRYVHWHLTAIRVVEMLEIPVLFIYYEDYRKGVSDATNRILSFLNLDRVGTKLPDFHSNKDYSQYFTDEERANASDLMKRLVAAKSSTKGRDLLERYWVELDIDKLYAQTKSIE